MMVLPTPPRNPSTPIENNPFYSPESFFTYGPFGALIVGTGLTVDYVNGTLNATGGGGLVTGIFAGAGISVSSNTGNVTVSALNLGTVTSITAGLGLAGGVITSSGTIALANTAVTPGSYTAPTLTINGQGQITSATSGSYLPTVNPVITGAGNSLTLEDGNRIYFCDTANSTSISLAGPATITTSVDYVLPEDGTSGQVLATDGSGNLSWATVGGGGVVSATPVIEGIVFGCTEATQFTAALGRDALCSLTTGTSNVAIGSTALGLNTTGSTNIAIGTGSLFNNSSGGQNIAIGQSALLQNVTNCSNIGIGYQSLWLSQAECNLAVGHFAGSTVTSGNCNILLGFASGGIGAPALTSGNKNVLIGHYVAPANPVGDCQLAIGVDSLCWLTGTSSGAIKPAAGIIDCAGSCGTAGQMLVSNGANAVCWANSPSVSAATPIALGTVYGCTTLLNAGLGYRALQITSGAGGTLNAALGVQAGCGITTGTCNVAIGTNAGNTIGSGSCNIIIGSCMTFGLGFSKCLAIGMGADRWLTGNSTFAIRPGAGLIDCTGSCGFTNYVLTSQGNALEWCALSGDLYTPAFGSFYTAGSQTLSVVNTPQPVQIGTTVSNNNVSIVGGTQITFAVGGRYNIQFSFQLLANPGGGGDYEIWFAKNGSPIPYSNTRFSVKNTNEAEFAALNFVETVIASEYIEIIWATDDLDNILYGTTSLFGGPDIPSAIITVVPVGT